MAHRPTSPPPPSLPPVRTRSPTPPSSSPTPSPPATSPQSPSWTGVSLQQPAHRKGPSRPKKLFRRVRSAFRSLPILTPACKFPMPLHGSRLHDGHIHGGTRMTGTLFGQRKARVNLAIQENPSSMPVLLLELTVQTGKLLQDMGMGLVRIAMECEKKPNEKTKIIDEPIWTMYCNGKKSGYGVKRAPTEDDLSVIKMLHVVSMGAGVIPGDGPAEQPDGELAYMRANFERVVGSKDSETYYMMNPDGNNGPELSIFFVRI